MKHAGNKDLTGVISFAAESRLKMPSKESTAVFCTRIKSDSTNIEKAIVLPDDNARKHR